MAAGDVRIACSASKTSGASGPFDGYQRDQSACLRRRRIGCQATAVRRRRHWARTSASFISMATALILRSRPALAQQFEERADILAPAAAPDPQNLLDRGIDDDGVAMTLVNGELIHGQDGDGSGMAPVSIRWSYRSPCIPAQAEERRGTAAHALGQTPGGRSSQDPLPSSDRTARTGNPAARRNLMHRARFGRRGSAGREIRRTTLKPKHRHRRSAASRRSYRENHNLGTRPRRPFNSGQYHQPWAMVPPRSCSDR